MTKLFVCKHPMEDVDRFLEQGFAHNRQTCSQATPPSWGMGIGIRPIYSHDSSQATLVHCWSHLEHTFPMRYYRSTLGFPD